MTNRMKEDEKIERTIRNLLKLPGNRRCINCNSLGPQYVCTTFWTFVCTNCSAIHREFTHRVKSVSMANFTLEEVSALQAGGNERAREIFFKEWDSQCNPNPDSSNLHRLRDFIKHVYVDRRYTGDRNNEKLPRLRLGDKENLYESRKIGAYGGGYRSPQYEDRYERCRSERSSPPRRSEDRNFKYYYDERRSPRYNQENLRHGSFRRNPIRFEVIDDRFRDEGSRRGRQFDNCEIFNKECKSGSRSPHSQRSMDRSSSPVVRPVKEVIGGEVPRLQVGESPRRSVGKDADNQKSGSPSSQPVENKRKCSESLINFAADTATAPQNQQTPWSTDINNSLYGITEKAAKAPQAPNPNTLESLLFELSSPSVVPVSNISDIQRSEDAPSKAQMSTSDNSFDASDGYPQQAIADTSSNSVVEASPGQHFPNTQQSQPTADSSTTGQWTPIVAGALDNQSWASALVPDVQGHSSASADQSSQHVPMTSQVNTSEVISQPLLAEPKSIGRKELLLDLFTSNYSSAPARLPGWQASPPHGMGFGVQYYHNANYGLPVTAFPNAARSSNPFDLNGEATQFPPMASLQGALANVPGHTDLLRTSSLGAQPTGLMAPHSPSYAYVTLPRSPSFASALPSGAYTGPQLTDHMPPSRLSVGGLGNEQAAFGSLDPTQQLTSGYSTPSTQHSFSSAGGNPFG